eukprot:5982709-Pleurochrysis_carterae.AAC.1
MERMRCGRWGRGGGEVPKVPILAGQRRPPYLGVGPSGRLAADALAAHLAHALAVARAALRGEPLASPALDHENCVLIAGVKAADLRACDDASGEDSEAAGWDGVDRSGVGRARAERA